MYVALPLLHVFEVRSFLNGTSAILRKVVLISIRFFSFVWRSKSLHLQSS